MKKTKIGIITINDYNNYGNRLQNYAVFKLLSNYGVTTNIVRKYGCEQKRFPDRKYYYLAFLYHKIINFFYFIIHFNELIYIKKRKKNFKNFNKLIVNSHVLNHKTNFDNLEKDFDAFVVGSDQVWNPNIPGNGMYINMLGFCKDNNKKISLSASISQDKLSQNQKKEFKKYLTNFSYLSCREENGSILIEKLTNKKCHTLLDPTLILDKNEWDSISKKPYFISNHQHYILVYMLGTISDEYNTIINYYSKTMGLEIINIYDNKLKYFSTGPSEFLWLIKNCDLMITDSYHGVIFSCIFEKNVKILNRKNGEDMNSRLITLKDKLCINNESFITIENYIGSEKNTSINHNNLVKEKKLTIDYLNSVFCKGNFYGS